MAKEESIKELDEEQRVIINICRDFYLYYYLPPMERIIIKIMERKFDSKLKGSKRYLYTKFKEEPHQVFKLAGMPKPNQVY
ncbi:hypothetical protein CO115_04490 [Candidatus Falkowbacteria bacterium CG_4_9_14_3_um_filter_36_9]|uniref:Sulfurtransferase TusE n=2 Tax=Candidatus Falkowiibacteriota TaxID=1752728 RepID=A0A1J4TBD3_9BACT|nr:MAG: hypothetical protein AUJ27_01805 [Candidatus Falkowbacteria bacterium CG1_02_37_44]PIV52173.1 MAG: hypothetical protein COS18_00020 [Candidatus Falkowbacteria bacterium CG02_land_8_20_14_3_00_36_14]PJA10619.1 MAG: hypothetical protein COX67_04135 [Candidatus Falkowbacteria bacterium CG_4_10_14_0_2_um_filter_36_22]PJB18448.1 MAG: hypothetical protein CO115_04490 [Candidatus Falkowbacteria bacterium CG_4_9_14_3_um_filter_36_9]